MYWHLGWYIVILCWLYPRAVSLSLSFNFFLCASSVRPKCSFHFRRRISLSDVNAQNAFLHLARPEEKQSWRWWIDACCAWDLQTVLYLAGISSMYGGWRDLQRSMCQSNRQCHGFWPLWHRPPLLHRTWEKSWLHFLPLYQRGGPFCLLGTDWLWELSWNSAGVSTPERIDPSHLFCPQKKAQISQWPA